MVRAHFTRSLMAAATSLLMICAVEGASAQEAATDSAIATVNGTVITSSDLNFIAEQLGEKTHEMTDAQKKEALTDTLVNMELISQEAVKQGLDKTDEFERQVKFLKLRALQNEFFRKNVDETITDEDLKAEYDKQIAAMPAQPLIKARHILVKTEEEAKDIIKQLDGGADFAELAKGNSTGPSGPSGGDLGYFTKGDMDATFEEAAMALETGAYTKEPVQTGFGWHVIQVEDKREVPKPKFEQVQDNLRSLVAQQKFLQLLDKLRSDAKIEIAE
ncbi:peptidylprolyl isomerase [uncultured Cohaesibacter sp.]|uniref:peptidylprolyl isomerase n=1 Tax=uncultured Cohaesibacter sp. TaxID=1002546 RepID=UPI002931F4AE|nr:peptidylprolyl isomerase [uncultured Cohaesibacter sp.]